MWSLSTRFDPAPRALADRHYNRQKVGSPQFVPPGRCLVLYGEHDGGRAFWVTSWPFAEYVRHAWAGAWVCSAFRNEGLGLSSELIRDAIAATSWKWPDTPDVGGLAMITFVDRSKTKPKRDPGYCYLMAGFESVGHSKGGLVALGIRRENLPEAKEPNGAQMVLA